MFTKHVGDRRPLGVAFEDTRGQLSIFVLSPRLEKWVSLSSSTRENLITKDGLARSVIACKRFWGFLRIDIT